MGRSGGEGSGGGGGDDCGGVDDVMMIYHSQRRLIHLPPDDIYVPDVINHRPSSLQRRFLVVFGWFLIQVCRNNDLPNTGPSVGFISAPLGECRCRITNQAKTVSYHFLSNAQFSKDAASRRLYSPSY